MAGSSGCSGSESRAALVGGRERDDADGGFETQDVVGGAEMDARSFSGERGLVKEIEVRKRERRGKPMMGDGAAAGSKNPFEEPEADAEAGAKYCVDEARKSKVSVCEQTPLVRA
jgi:hypothetical protein